MPTLSGKPALPSKLCFLYSFAYVQPKYYEFINQLGNSAKVIMDSGGFTVYWASIRKAAGLSTSMKPVELANYIEFCKQVNPEVEYIALDLPRNQDVTLQNLQVMLDAGVRPMPVFCEGMAWERLSDLISINERICVAGGVYSKDDYILSRFSHALRLSDGRARIHGLGYTRYPEILGSGIQSGDSTTWLNWGFYKTCFMFHPVLGIKKFAQKRLFSRGNKELLYWFYGVMDACHISMDELNNKDFWKPRPSCVSGFAMLSNFFHLWLMGYLQERGIDYYLALAGNIGNNGYTLSLLATLLAIGENSYPDYRAYVDAWKKYKEIKSMDYILEMSEYWDKRQA